MNAPREKILGLIASGKISAREGELLLAALQPARGGSASWLLAPFERVQLWWAWALAAGVSVGSFLLHGFQIRFDGTLDLHVVDSEVSWRLALLDQFVAWPLTTLVFWGVARLARQKAHLVELLGFVGAARLPQLLAALVAVLVVSSSVPLAQNPTGLLILVGTGLPLLGWTCLLLLSAFRAASGSQGRKLMVAFSVALVLAEVLGKVCLGVLT